MKIKNLNFQIILDSRKEKTIEIEMFSENFSAKASVGKGKSRGSKEIYLIEPEKAQDNFFKIKNLLLNKDFSNLQEFENFLFSLDQTENKSQLGGNFILTLSIAFLKILAKEKGVHLFNLLREEFLSFFPELKSEYKNYYFPYFLFNFINGGKHVPWGPDFQEYLVIPFISEPEISFNLGKIIFSGLKEYFQRNKLSLDYGDEGGLIYPEKNNEEPLKIILKVIKDLDLDSSKVKLGLDVAASSFLTDDFKEEYFNFYKDLSKNYDLFYLEDPFRENDFLSFQKLNNELGKKTLIVGDDLTVTNPLLIEKTIKERAIGGVIIKPTQIGSITETFKAIKKAIEGGLKIIISHRSGETEDDFLADLSIAVNAFGLKSGSLTQKERLVKYQRVIEINKILKYEKNRLC
ncbi:MAG: hypothetical protein ACPLXL_01730 [Minisyncoccia bacterium]